jgi:hypothetical protein
MAACCFKVVQHPVRLAGWLLCRRGYARAVSGCFISFLIPRQTTLRPLSAAARPNAATERVDASKAELTGSALL